MQGTVATFDPETRTGTLLLDDGAELHLPAGAFDGAPFRLLRPGQRVTFALDDEGRISSLGLSGLS